MSRYAKQDRRNKSLVPPFHFCLQWKWKLPASRKEPQLAVEKFILIRENFPFKLRGVLSVYTSVCGMGIGVGVWSPMVRLFLLFF